MTANAVGLTAGNITIAGLVSDGGAGTTSLVANVGTISETGTLVAGTLTGSSVGTVALTGDNTVAALGASAASPFSAVGQSFTLVDNGAASLAVNGLSAATVSLTALAISIPGALSGTTSVALAATESGISETGTVTTPLLTGSSAGTVGADRHEHHRCGGSQCGVAIRCGGPELHAGGRRRGLAGGEWAQCRNDKPDRAGGQHPRRADRHDRCRPGGHRRRDQRDRHGNDPAADRQRCGHGEPDRQQRHRCAGRQRGVAVQCGGSELHAGGRRGGLAGGERAERRNGKPDRAGDHRSGCARRNDQRRPGRRPAAASARPAQ